MFPTTERADISPVRLEIHLLYGDVPNIPWEVRQEKRIMYKIGDKSNFDGGEESYILESNTFEDEGVIGPTPRIPYRN